MATAATTSDVKRAKPQLNVYTGLLTVALLLVMMAGAWVAKMNMDATKAGPFDTASSR
jgi:hypothetical protein